MKGGYDYVALEPWEWLVSAGVPRRYAYATLDDCRESAPNAVQWLEEWNRGTGMWCVVFTGPIGSGKTHIAAATMARFVRHMPSLWVSWPALVAEVADSWKGGGETSLLKRVTRTGCLVIDDFGAEGALDEALAWQKRIAYEVINERYNVIKPTIITTSLTGGDIGRMFDPALTSRLEEGKAFRLTATDRRKRPGGTINKGKGGPSD